MHKTTLLGLFAPQPEPSIEDPFDQEPDQARATIGAVMSAVEGLADWSLNTAPG
jgi:hypothetical protein